MSRRKLLLLDEPYHAQTRSSDFFVEILRTRYDVTVDYLKGSSRDSAAWLNQVRSHSPDLVVLWQVALPAQALNGLELPTIWVPMYDQSRRRWHQNYLEAAQAGVSVLAFSRAVEEFARFWALPCLNVCYYPPPGPMPDFEVGNDRVLLWYRGFIQPAQVWPVLAGIPEVKVVLKQDVDPGAQPGTRDDGELAGHVERVVQGFLPRDEYAALMSGCGLFVAPRRKEGIGLSFLEAMARGALVVGYDGATMNEYIVHGKTGWLFSGKSVPSINPGEAPGIRRAGYEQAVAGHLVWESRQEAVLNFVDSARAPARRWGLKALAAVPVAATIRWLTPLKRRVVGG